MNFLDYLRAMRRHWILVCLAVVIFGGVAAGYSEIQTPIYSTRIQMFVSTTGNESDLSQLNQGGNFATARVQSYVRIVNSPIVLQRVIDKLGLKETSKSLAGHVSASSPLETVILNVEVSDPSPQSAQEIANAISDIFPEVVDEIEAPRAGGASPVRVSVTERAPLPTRPSKPKNVQNTIFGLIAGVFIGALGAIARYTFDKRIRSRDDIEALADVPLLPGISVDHSIGGRVAAAEAGSPSFVEEIRQLRTSIRFLAVDRRLSSFVITSSVESEGKTTIVANLAVAIARAGDRVVLIDGDLRRPRLANAFNLPDGVGLTNVLLGDIPMNRAMQQWRDDLDLFVVSSGPIPPNPSELLSSDQVSKIVQKMVDSGYIVIFDSPPLFLTDASLLARATDGAVVVVRMNLARKDHLNSSLAALKGAGSTTLGIVPNGLQHSKGTGRYVYSDGPRSSRRRKRSVI